MPPRDPLSRTLRPALAALLLAAAPALAQDGERQTVGQSPWGPEDEIGRLNLMTKESRAAILSRVEGGEIHDLGVEYFVGMPSWQAAGDPHYRMWMTHTPEGTVIDDPLGLGREMNEHVSYTGTALSMYAHTGTHIDALNHFGLDGAIHNGFEAEEHLGDRGWNRTGAETIPPIVARGVLIDVAGAKGVEMLEPSYHITPEDLEAALDRQGTDLREGDVVLVRTGRMTLYESDPEAYMTNSPGIGLPAARWLAERGAMVVGADNLSLEASPSEVEDNYLPVHTYLLAGQGIPIIELVDLEGIAEAGLHEFAFLAASPKFRGLDASVMRPIALPLRPE